MTDPVKARAGMSKGTLTLSILTFVVALVAVVMVRLGNASLLEGISFVTGAVCVWLTVKENVWNFPVGALNAATFSVVFYRAHLFGDAGLQIVYFVLNLMGWYMWLYGGERHSTLHVVRASPREIGRMSVAVVVATLLFYPTLRFLANLVLPPGTQISSSTSFWDGATTCISLGAQWWMNQKRVETWHLWIVVDILYVPLYFYRGLALTGLLYAVFLVMAVMGLQQWTETWKTSRGGSRAVNAPS